MQKFQYLIIGGGIAGTTCAETLRGLNRNPLLASYPMSRIIYIQESRFRRRITSSVKLPKSR